MSSSMIPDRGAKGAGTNATRGANDLSVPIKRHVNHFNRGYRNYVTARFGEVVPIFMKEVINKEYASLGCDINMMMNRPLVSPMLSDVFLHRFFTYVPFSAIYPHGWEYMKTMPSYGPSAAPEDAWSKIDIHRFYAVLSTYVEKISNCVDSSHFVISDFYVVLSMLSLLSANGLLNNLGICACDSLHLSYKYCDDIYDALLDALNDKLLQWGPDNSPLSFHFDSPEAVSEWLDYMYSSSYHRIENPSLHHWDDNLKDAIITAMKAAVAKKPSSSLSGKFQTVSLIPLFAFKLVEAEFFTNSDIDDIYSADRLSQVMYDGIISLFDDAGRIKWTYQGASVLFDWTSSHFWNEILIDFVSYPNDSPNQAFVPYLCTLCFPCFSLKYGDYFTGCRVTPLSVGDGDTISVSGNKVQTMDINQNILLLRLRQAANRLGPKFRDQIQGIFGIAPGPKTNIPKFLGHDKHLLNKDLVVSTATVDPTIPESSLGHMAANININDIMSSRFDTTIDDNGLVMTLAYTDAKSVYPYSTDTLAFKSAPLDFYNPYLENFGDMVIEKRCIDPASSVQSGDVPGGILGYAAQFTDYRESFNRASGAFATDPALQSFYYQPSLRGDTGGTVYNIDSHFLRTQPSTFNKFYGSTMHYGSKAYHFIMDVQNVFDSYSPVSIYPDLLFGQM